nr:GTPase IMAP family member 8-like isoform X2 [Danio rerio]|eukprot:XP_017210360.2 GTPase IMAP family member 8-like isoform X2 [Danio rerio]
MMMMEEEQQKQEKEGKRREEEFREREERYKRLIKEREQKENELIEQMKLERMQKQKPEERLRREKEKQKSELHKRRQSPVRELTAGLNVVLLGKRGAGKTASGNTILGRQAFITEKSPKSVTRDVTVESGTFCEQPVTVYDTPGLSDIEMSEEEIQQMINEKVLQKCSSGLCVFLLVIRADRFTDDDRKTVEKIEKILGEKHQKNTWILFTGGDELEEENTRIQEFIEETEELKTLVQKYEHRYHLFNNKRKMKKDEEGLSEQVKILLTKILKPYTMGEEINPLKRKIPENIGAVSPVSSPPSRRIVLVGKSGVGKSAAGNTILGQREFRSAMSVFSVTFKCSAAQTTVSGRSVSVVDTPGFFNTQMKPEELMMEMARSVYISSPGPHAFLIVFPVNMRFTEYELQILQMIELMFGQEVLKYSIILFTHGDLLDGESVEELIEENSRLRSLVQQCGGRYHVFNNRDEENREQVEDLLQKIDSMIQQNGGGHYTNQMYEDAQRFRQEEEEERQREEEERQREEEERQREEEKRKRQEDKQIQEVIEREIKKTAERIKSEDQGRKQSENCVCS